MTDPRYFINFAPADAVQYDGINGDTLAVILGRTHDDWTHAFNAFCCGTRRVQVGQWLVRQGARVWVQDEEPARVERWETGRMSPGGDVWDHDWLSWWPEYRRPVLSNGWTGPWSPAEGGAE